MAFVGTKGWFVKELKALGITKHEGHKLETYKASALSYILRQVKEGKL